MTVLDPGRSVSSNATVEAGQPFVLENSAGNVIAPNRGVIRHTALFDTLGDGMLGAVFLEEIHTAVHRPHPGLAEDSPFCEIAAELAGAQRVWRTPTQSRCGGRI
jgi:hypothetical protein